jgi:hypothetical protein
MRDLLRCRPLRAVPLRVTRLVRLGLSQLSVSTQLSA